MSEKLKVIILISSVCVIGFAGNLYFKYLRSLPQDYIPGTVIKVSKPAKGNDVVQYEYFIGIKRYTGIVKLEGSWDIVGQRFLVSYPEDYPSKGKMLLDNPVPDSITSPEEGWDELPEFAR